MTKKLVGTIHEKRGDDTLKVYLSDAGDVLEIEQYDARAAYSKYSYVNLWTESVPGLVKLLQKAAGIKPEKEEPVEWEYNIRTTKNGQNRVFYHHWCSYEDMLDMWGKGSIKAVKESLIEGWTLIKRPKAGEIQDA